MKYSLNDVWVFDTETSTMHPGPAEYVPSRTSHAACLIGKSMIVHGGIGSEGSTMSDLWHLNLDYLKWQFMMSAGVEARLSHHTIAGAYNNSLDHIEPFQPAHEKKPWDRSGIMREGIYIFGGKDLNGNPKNDLYIINTDSTKRYFLEKVEVLGKKPHARYGHTMIYYHPKQYMFIYGGRNDLLWGQCGNCTMSDIQILNLKYLIWIPVTCSNGDMPRYSMSCFMDKTKIYVVGGINNQSYVSSCVECLETDGTLVPDIDVFSEDQYYIDNLLQGDLRRLAPFKVPSETLKAHMKTRGYLMETDYDFNKPKEIKSPRKSRKKYFTGFDSLNSSFIRPENGIFGSQNLNVSDIKHGINDTKTQSKPNFTSVMNSIGSINQDNNHNSSPTTKQNRRSTIGQNYLKQPQGRLLVNALRIPLNFNLVSFQPVPLNKEENMRHKNQISGKITPIDDKRETGKNTLDS